MEGFAWGVAVTSLVGMFLMAISRSQQSYPPSMPVVYSESSHSDSRAGLMLVVLIAALVFVLIPILAR